ncbi:MAG TPA: hypothetical protein VHR66_14025 [Gemmataceae bacterium]|jgi:hypothetical protein|nr:hypothetical protein [Gemmataceae bacterium]
MEVAADVGFRRSPGWAFILLVLVAAQGWLTLHLFGPGLPIDRLTNDEPVLDGRHPLHSYHGLLGYRSWHVRQATTCYDPAFQAGYLKTPIFDAGSRPAELFYLVGGPTPASYKIGLAICCMLSPLCFALAGRGAGVNAGGSCLAGLIGTALFWSPPCRAMLEAGDLDLLMGGMCAPVYLAWLARFERNPGPVEWLVIAGSAAVGWYMQPLVMVGAVALSLLFHLWAFRSVRFAWHLGLLSANFVGLGVNGFWLWDWGTHLWMYVPYGGADAPLSTWPAAFQEWEAFLPHDPVELAACAVGVVGLFIMSWRSSVAAGLLGAGAVLYVAGGGAGKLWPVLAEVGTQKLQAVGIWCCAVPCAYAMNAISQSIGSSSGVRLLGIVWLAVGLAGITFGLDLPGRWNATQLEIGLGGEREDIVRSLREKSTADGRILWEDRSDITRGSGWTALLPELTQRQYLGGLSPETAIDHLHIRLADGKLIGRPLGDWTDIELARFFDRYNVTRIVCRCPESIARVRRLEGATAIGEFKNGAGVLFAIDRKPSFILTGRGQVTQMDWQRVALTDVEPDANGVIVLSLHHHVNWHVSPAYVAVEKDVDVNDPIPLLRLRLPGPTTRVTLTWTGE